MKPSFGATSMSRSTTSADDWFKVRNNKGDLPFDFKPEHSSNGFKSVDFGIWSAIYPKEAKKHFSSVVINTLCYSWEKLCEMTGEKPHSNLSGFAENINHYPWLKQEFLNWGNLLTYIWIGSFDTEPLIYKLTDRRNDKWQINKYWINQDGFTPKVYTFKELAFQERLILLDDADTEPCHVSPPIPNIGAQSLNCFSLLILLQPEWGFNEKGHIAYFGKGCSQLVAQTKNLSKP
jgi:hypothetical protein